MDNLTLVTVRALLARRYFILAFTGVVFCFALLRAVLFPSTSFRAEVILVATSPIIVGELGEPVADTSSPKVYHELAGSPTVIEETRQRLIELNAFGEEGAPAPKDFAAALSAQINVVDQTARPINYSPLITLTVRSNEPELAKTIVNEWAVIAMRSAKTANYLRIGVAARVLGEREADQKAGLEAIWRARQEEEAAFNLVSKQEELRLRLALIARLIEERNLTERNRDDAEARLAAAREGFAGMPSVLELLEAPSDVAIWLLEGDDKRQALDALQEKGMVTQELNTVYWDTRLAEQEALQALAGETAKLASIEEQLVALRQEQDALQAELSQRQMTQSRLLAEEEAAIKVYDELVVTAAGTATVATLVGGALEPGDGGDVSAVGLNRLSEITAIQRDSVLGRKGSLVVYSVLGFLVACAFVTLSALAEIVFKRLEL